MVNYVLTFYFVGAGADRHPIPKGVLGGPNRVLWWWLKIDEVGFLVLRALRVRKTVRFNACFIMRLLITCQRFR